MLIIVEYGNKMQIGTSFWIIVNKKLSVKWKNIQLPALLWQKLQKVKIY